MKASLFYLPSIGSRAEIEAGMAGMNPHFYQRMLGELSEQIKLGDALGYDSVSFTEHHFHIEGFELSNNPVLLDLYFAMQTKRIRVGQLGIGYRFRPTLALLYRLDPTDPAGRRPRRRLAHAQASALLTPATSVERGAKGNPKRRHPSHGSLSHRSACARRAWARRDDLDGRARIRRTTPTGP